MNRCKVILWTLAACPSAAACASGKTGTPRVAANAMDVEVLCTEVGLLQNVQFST